jgi:hypothetical protein
MVVVANEHYGRLDRLLTRNVPVRVEINVDAAVTSDAPWHFGTLAPTHSGTFGPLAP